MNLFDRTGDGYRREIEVFAADGTPPRMLIPRPVLETLKTEIAALLAEGPMGQSRSAALAVELSQTFKWPNERTISHPDYFVTNLGVELAAFPVHLAATAIREEAQASGREWLPGPAPIAKRCHQIRLRWLQQRRVLESLISEHERREEEAEARRARAEGDRRDEARWRSIYGDAPPAAAGLPVLVFYEQGRVSTVRMALNDGREWAPALARRLASLPDDADDQREAVLAEFGLTRRPPPHAEPRAPFDHQAHERQLADFEARMKRREVEPHRRSRSRGSRLSYR